MLDNHTHITKILDGQASLGRSQINKASLTVNGGPIPPNMIIDEIGGTVQWASPQDVPVKGTDEYNLRYTFSYQHFKTAEVKLELSSYTAMVNEEVNLSVFSEDQTADEVIVAVYNYRTRLGTIAIPMTNGAGSKLISSELVGTYRILPDPEDVDTKYNRPYNRGNEVILEVV